jgi:hypothetical protein
VVRSIGKEGAKHQVLVCRTDEQVLMMVTGMARVLTTCSLKWRELVPWIRCCLGSRSATRYPTSTRKGAEPVSRQPQHTVCLSLSFATKRLRYIF